MKKEEELKRLLSDTLNIDASDIDGNFLLKTGKLGSSAGSVILGNIVKKVYGIKVNCSEATTFGELVHLVNEGQIIMDEALPAEDAELKARDAGLPFISMNGQLVCGIDIQDIDVFPEAEDYWTEGFYTESFTRDEIAYCVAAPSPRHSFAARWCVKEALHKCSTHYYGLPLTSIQVVKQRSGAVALEVLENGSWKILPFSCSLSHADSYAVGIVVGFDR